MLMSDQFKAERAIAELRTEIANLGTRLIRWMVGGCARDGGVDGSPVVLGRVGRLAPLAVQRDEAKPLRGARVR